MCGVGRDWRLGACVAYVRSLVDLRVAKTGFHLSFCLCLHGRVAIIRKRMGVDSGGGAICAPRLFWSFWLG